MSRRIWYLAPPLLAALAGCSDRTTTTSPHDATPPSLAPPAHSAKLEQLARKFARALADPVFRAYVKAELDASPVVEHKLHFQRFLGKSGGRARRELARASGETESQVDQEAQSALPAELYVPVPEHRSRWSGDAQVLVATAVADGDAPIAFDVTGNRQVLSPSEPPSTPVIALVPVETDFDRLAGPALQTCQPEDACGGGGGGGGSVPQPPAGLFMTYAHFVDDFEGWLKGNPEFEIHIMGQLGQSDSLLKYQCVGEHAGGPYVFDQNKRDWWGSVLLFSQAQLDAYKAQHPNHAIRIVALEDDDTACQMKVDQNRFRDLMNAIGPAYKDVTGAIDTITIAKIIKAKTSLEKLLAAVASWIKTNDELIGNAIEDKVVGQYFAGANWIVKGSGNVTNGWLKLEMR